MNKAKPISILFASHFKLSKEKSPKTKDEHKHMKRTPYASAIGSFMYVIVCNKSNTSHAVEVISRHMNNPDMYHWEVMKCIPRYLRERSTEHYALKM